VRIQGAGGLNKGQALSPKPEEGGEGMELAVDEEFAHAEHTARLYCH